MMELLGKMPDTMAIGGVHYRKFFNRHGRLRNIHGLRYWPLKRVLMEKYKFIESEADALTDFLLPMLEWKPDKRATAKKMLDHPWLKMPANYECKMSDKEFREKMIQTKFVGEDDRYFNEEMCKLEPSDTEQAVADKEVNFEEEADTQLSEGDEAFDPKQYRDLAEGKNINNSFTGPYPENWDHLHIDKGPNPQFLVFNDPSIIAGGQGEGGTKS